MSMTSFTVRRALAIILCLGVFVAAACGGDDDPASPDPSGESTTSTDAATPGETGDADAADDDDADGDATADDDDAEGSSDDDATADLPDACDLLDGADVEALIGPAVTESDSGQTLDGLAFSECVWSNETRQMVGVALTSTTTRFDSHVANIGGDPVDGLGDEAITMGGVSLETTGATGGRTISMAVGDRTVVVGLRVEGQTTVDMVRPLAESVLASLGD